MAEKLSPIHPGEVLLEEFIKPMNLSQNRLAIDIGVDARRINEIVLGKRSITADTALRLARFFGNSPQFWLGLQTQYDLDVTEDQLGKRLDREVRPYATVRRKRPQPNPVSFREWLPNLTGFDFKKAKPNRFAARMKDEPLVVMIEPDVAKVFKSSEDVNKALRALLSALPEKK